MDNTQFLDYLRDKMKAVDDELKAEGLTDERRDYLKKQRKLLTDSLKIMTYGTGPQRRRFRRDYERRLGL